MFLYFCCFVCAKKKSRKRSFSHSPIFRWCDIWQNWTSLSCFLLLCCFCCLCKSERFPRLCRRFSPLFGSSFPFSDSKLSFSALTMLTQFQTIFYLSDNQTDIYPIWYFYFFSFLFLQFSRDGGVFSISMSYNDNYNYLLFWFMIFFIPGCM